MPSELHFEDDSVFSYEDIKDEDKTCFNCIHKENCEFAFDDYNTNGDCLAEK